MLLTILFLDANGKPFKVVKYATDITQSKLKNAEFEGKINAISRSQAIIEFELDGTIITANDNFLKTLGYALEDITGRHHRIFCDEEYAETYEYKLFWEKLASGAFNSGEYKRIGNHGKEIWINASYNPIFDADGKPYKVVKFASDITETKLFNAEFEGQISAISKAQAIIEFDTKGNILTANDNFLATLGYSLGEIKGKHHRMFCETDYVNSKEYDLFWEKLARGEYDSGEYKRIGKNGKEIWINASYNPILDANGKPYKVVKFATDTTAHKLESSEYQGKIDAISKAQAIIEFDPEGHILTANDNFLTTLGYSLNEIKGKHHKMFCEEAYTASDEYKLFWIKLANGEFDSGRYKRIGSGGKVVWIQATYNPIFDLNGKIFKVVKFAVEITNQVELEEKVTQISVEFSDKAQEMSVQAGTVSDGAQSLGATTEEMNASVEELSASIDSIAHNTKEADEIAKNTQNEANLGSQAIAKSIESMELINKSSEDISEIVKVISEIASQTNLLAFNAAIEAARAGEHGLGFSVVADEVRKLAERSSLATKDITKLINETVKRVTQGGEISREAAEGFKKIVDGVAKTTKSISEISVAAQEQQIAAKDVSNAIQQVVDSTEESAIASEAISRSTDELAAGSERLRSEMKKFASY